MHFSSHMDRAQCTSSDLPLLEPADLQMMSTEHTSHSLQLWLQAYLYPTHPQEGQTLAIGFLQKREHLDRLKNVWCQVKPCHP